MLKKWFFILLKVFYITGIILPLTLCAKSHNKITPGTSTTNGEGIPKCECPGDGSCECEWEL